MTLTTVDYIIIGLVLVGGIWGAIKGLIEEVARKFGYVCGLLVALMFTKSFSPVFVENLDFPLWLASCCSYVLLFLAGYLVVKLLGKILQTIFETANLTAVDNILGFIIGVFEAIAVIGVLEILFQHQTFFNFERYFDESIISTKVILPFCNWLTTLVHKVF